MHTYTAYFFPLGKKLPLTGGRYQKQAANIGSSCTMLQPIIRQAGVLLRYAYTDGTLITYIMVATAASVAYVCMKLKRCEAGSRLGSASTDVERGNTLPLSVNHSC